MIPNRYALQVVTRFAAILLAAASVTSWCWPGPVQAAGMVTAEGNLVRVETKTLKAVLDRGLLTSLVRKSDNVELVKASADERQALQLVYTGGTTATLGYEIGDRVRCLQINDNLVHVRVESWYGDGVIAVSADTESGDLIIEPSAYASRPGLRACRWVLAGIQPGLELIAPFFQGVRLAFAEPLVKDSHWPWPHSWEAGLVILQGAKGGLWVHCRDSQYRYKSLKVGTPGDERSLGFDTDAYGPLDNSLGAGGLAWRINVYAGGWEEPAAVYREWLAKAYGMENRTRPQWVERVKLALSWVRSDPALLEALSAKVKPERILLHVSDWRSDGYDQNYPTYEPSRQGEQFIRKAIEMGFHAMPHFNSVDMDPTHPTYNYIRDFQYRDLETRRVQGWSWYQGSTKPVPESNAARMRHQSENTMVKVHPGLSMWRSILAENILPAARRLSLEVVFLDVTLCCWNIHNTLVENTTPAQGMKELEALIGSLGGGLVVGGEGRNEITMQDQQFSQVHLYQSWQSNREGLERLVTCPLNEYLFGKWSRSFGYTRLSGRTEEEVLRHKLHADLGAIPTITVRSAGEITNPNPAVKAILEEAAR